MMHVSAVNGIENGVSLATHRHDALDVVEWRVIQTKPRQEKILAQDLAALGIDHFLPLQKRTNIYGKRKIISELPLFPGYLFLKGTLEEAYLADRTRRVAQIIRAVQQEQLEQELRNLKLAIDGEMTLDPYPYLKAGVRAEVKAGPLRGMQGIVEQRLGGTRLILQVDMLSQAVSLEIDGSLLELID